VGGEVGSACEKFDDKNVAYWVNVPEDSGAS